MNAGRLSTIMTASGRVFDYTTPHPSMICIEDIAHALSHICRYAGHCTQFYSVAEHSVLCSMLVEDEHALAALLHDAAEAYCVDVPKPLKRLLPCYEAVEDRVEVAIAERFGLTLPLHPEIKRVDHLMLLAEGSRLHRVGWGLESYPGEITVDVKAAARMINPLSPALAKTAFLQRYNSLTRGAQS